MKRNFGSRHFKSAASIIFVGIIMMPFQNCSNSGAYIRGSAGSDLASTAPASPGSDTGASVPVVTGMMPYIDVSKIPTGDPGVGDLRVYPVLPESLDPALKDINSPKFNINAYRNWNTYHQMLSDRGEPLFLDSNDLQTTVDTGKPSVYGGDARTSCKFSHMKFDDPIVFPGKPGRSHLHAFFGNVSVDANSTSDTLVAAGNSTCNGGIGNRSAYWVPAMIDTRTGTPVKPEGGGFYYKHGSIKGTLIKTIPKGLRMIAGNSSNKTATGNPNAARFKCIGGPNNQNALYGPGIGNCDKGAELWSEVFFPQCWDGVNLDSADHKSHMAYPVYNPVTHIYYCPATHPYPIPSITYNIIYKVRDTDDISKWRLASDNYDPSLPGGYSSHGDYMFGWQKDVIEGLVQCSSKEVDCHSHLLGDGRWMSGY